jgi:hypothetical protein
VDDEQVAPGIRNARLGRVRECPIRPVIIGSACP